AAIARPRTIAVPANHTASRTIHAIEGPAPSAVPCAAAGPTAMTTPPSPPRIAAIRSASDHGSDGPHGIANFASTTSHTAARHAGDRVLRATTIARTASTVPSTSTIPSAAAIAFAVAATIIACTSMQRCPSFGPLSTGGRLFGFGDLALDRA